MQLGSSGLGVGTQAPVNPLLIDLVLYVDSATGSDSNPGTQALPFATLARAWSERQSYSELRAPLRVQLIGAGPYDMPAMGASVCSEDGSFTICGDSAAETIIATGTATGDFAANVLPTSALAVNIARDEFLRMTSGNCVDAVFQVNENAANSITVSNVRARTTNGAIANGDTWQVIRPGTQLRITLSSLVTAPVPHVIGSWIGATSGSSLPNPLHWLYNVRVITTDASALRAFGAQLGLAMVRLENGALFFNSQIVCGVVNRSTQFGIASVNRDLLFGAGAVVSAGLWFFQSCAISGVFTYAGSSGSFSDCVIIWGGGRAAAGTTLQLRTALNTIGGGQDILINATITVSAGGLFRPGATGTVRFALTAGSCVRVTLDGCAVFGSPSPTGGTTDAAAYAVDVRGGGKCFFQNVLPNFAGVAGNDLRTTNVTAANAVLAANGTPAGNAADALLGEVLARVA